jgi:CelD/BcsL family acetyltransferase involved in cellulose biosynthesis
VQATIVENVAALQPLEPTWRALAEERGNAFVSPEWFGAFLRQYGEAFRPFVAVVRNDAGEVLGLLPLVVSTSGRRRILQFAGANLGDCFHPVCAEAADEMVAAACAAALAKRNRDWNMAVFHHVPADAAWPRAFVQASQNALALTRDTPFALPFLRLDGLDWTAFLAARSTSLRKALAYELRRLERSHAVSFSCAASADQVRTGIDRFLELHDLRWSDRGGSSLATERAHLFLRDFAHAAFDAGWLRLWAMEIDGQPIAEWFGWKIGSRYAFFQSGFDPAWSRNSPGLLLVAHTIRQAIEEGARDYDMLLGDEAYKARFGPDRRSVATVVVTPSLHPLRVLTMTDLALRRLARALPAGPRARIHALATPLLRRLPTSRSR